MDDLTRAPGTDTEAALALLGGCNSETDGVELAYQALDLVVARFHLSEAHLVLRPGSMAPQIFAHGRRHVTPDRGAALAQRPSGLYADPDTVPVSVQDALTGCCEMALAAHAARLGAGRVVPGLSSRPVMEEAVRRAASRGARFRWRSTLVVLGTAGPGPVEARWRALVTAVRSARRVCDEVGVAGPGLAATILADAGLEDVEAYVGRLLAALARDGEAEVRFLVGAASTPTDSVDPDQLWKLCDRRLAEGAPEGWAGGVAGSDRPPSASEVELELRRLPDVVSVGTSGLDDPGAAVRQVTVVARRRSETLDREVAALTSALLPGVPVTVLAADSPQQALAGPAGGPTEPVQGVSSNGGRFPALDAGSVTVAPSGGSTPRLPPSTERRTGPPTAGPGETPPRVVLLLSEFDRSTGTSEVSLAWRGATAVGQAMGTPMAGAAQATLSAVEALGTRVPYLLTSVERATSDPRSPVVVALTPRKTEPPATGDRRFGVAQAGDEVTAASRATLAALNRYLSVVKGAQWPHR